MVSTEAVARHLYGTHRTDYWSTSLLFLIGCSFHRCYPFDEQPEGGVKEPCFFSGRPATHMALFGRAY